MKLTEYSAFILGQDQHSVNMMVFLQDNETGKIYKTWVNIPIKQLEEDK